MALPTVTLIDYVLKWWNPVPTIVTLAPPDEAYDVGEKDVNVKGTIWFSMATSNLTKPKLSIWIVGL